MPSLIRASLRNTPNNFLPDETSIASPHFLPAVFPVHVHTCFRVPDSRFTQADDDFSLNVMQNGGKLQDAFSVSISAAFNRNPSINELSEANLPGQA
jgi:hypothetical protein